MWKQAWRSIRSSPGYALAVVGTLALGIGANSAIFSLVDSAILRPLPYPESGQLVAVYQRNERLHEEQSGFSPIRIEEISRQSQTLQGFAGHYTDTISETSGPLPERLTVAYVTAGFFDVFRMIPTAGRPFNEEERRHRHPVDAVMISHRLWVERFQADPRMEGKVLRLGKASIPIAGVVPKSFAYPNQSIDLWRTVNFEDRVYSDPSIRFFTVVARIESDTAVEQSRGEVSALLDRLDRDYPKKEKGWSIEMSRLQTFGAEKYAKTLELLFGAVVLLLVLACANVAALNLSRLDMRTRELSLRAALGANRGQLLRGLLAEAAVLAVGGAAVGLVLAQWMVVLFRDWAIDLPRGQNVAIDGRVVLFTLLTAAFATLLFALIPSWRASKANATDGFRGMSSRASTAPDSPMRRYLVAVQLGVAMILLSGAVLLGRTVWALSSSPTGFDAANVSTFRITAGWGESTQPATVQARFQRTLARLRTIPGVVSAGITVALPPTGLAQETNFKIEAANAGSISPANSRAVSSGYFDTLRIPILMGAVCRDEVVPPAPPDTPARPVEALVNQAFVDRYLNNRTVIGQSIRAELGNGVSYPLRIDGVVANVREEGPGIAVKPTVYSCGLPGYYPDPVFLVRAKPGVEITNSTIREEIRQVSPTRAVYAFQTLLSHMGSSIGTQRRNAILFGGFSFIALLLAALGLFAVMNQSVNGRLREIGVRLAIGATPAQIGKQFARRAAAMFALGLAIGLPGSIALSKFIESILFGTSPLDPLVFLSVPLVLFLVSAIAVYRPTRRAAYVDPMESLRAD